MKLATAIFGGISISMWMWSAHPTEELLALHDEAVRLFTIVRDPLFARSKEKSPALAGAVQRRPAQGFESYCLGDHSQ